MELQQVDEFLVILYGRQKGTLFMIRSYWAIYDVPQLAQAPFKRQPPFLDIGKKVQCIVVDVLHQLFLIAGVGAIGCQGIKAVVANSIIILKTDGERMPIIFQKQPEESWQAHLGNLARIDKRLEGPEPFIKPGIFMVKPLIRSIRIFLFVYSRVIQDSKIICHAIGARSPIMQGNSFDTFPHAAR